MVAPDVERLFQNYADVIVNVGVNLQPGQKLKINAPLDAAPLVRKIAASAYKKGCRFVDVTLSDEQITLTRYQYAPRDSFDEFPAYLAQGMVNYAEQGDAFLSLTGEDPDLLKGQDPDLISRAQKAQYKLMAPFYQMLSRNAFNWSIVGYPTAAWAAKVFSDEQQISERENKLWRSIYQVCRVYSDDPVEAWRSHVADLMARCAYMTARQYQAMKYRGPGTALTVGLSDNHSWRGGGLTTNQQVTFTPNLPTEEIFTMPHKDRVRWGCLFE